MASKKRIRKPINIYLNPGQPEALKKLSAKTGAPVAEIVRRAIDQYLKRS